MFDFVESLFGVKSPSELVELSTAHARTQFETLTGAEQGACRARAEGRDRDRRADQDRRQQGDEEGRLTPDHRQVSDCVSPGRSPGLFALNARTSRRDKGRGGNPCQERDVAPSFRRRSCRLMRACAAVAQLVRAPVCGTGGRWFEPTQLYHSQFAACSAPPNLKTPGPTIPAPARSRRRRGD